MVRHTLVSYAVKLVIALPKYPINSMIMARDDSVLPDNSQLTANIGASFLQMMEVFIDDVS